MALLKLGHLTDANNRRLFYDFSIPSMYWWDRQFTRDELARVARLYRWSLQRGRLHKVIGFLGSTVTPAFAIGRLRRGRNWYGPFP